jgi:hypothetical protein
MRNLIKTGVTVASIAILSLVGFTAAFGYGGGGGGSSGGSGWVDPRCYTPVHPPAGGFHFWGVPGHDVFNRNVQFDIDGGDASYMMISDKPDFDGATMEPYSKSKAAQIAGSYGSKMFYIRFFNYCRIPTNVFSWNFNYRQYPRVLGAQAYADGTLLRGSDNRIYVVKGATLTYIPSLTELLKYVGKEILKVDDSVIVEFATLNAPQQEVLGSQAIANGTLIRGSDKKIYVIIKGVKVHIRSLDELAKNYLGKEILDVEDDVLALY